MRVSVYSLQNTLFSGTAEKLICCTPQGQITVLDRHLPLISTLNGPAVELVDNTGKRTKIEISSGVLEVRPESEVVLLVNS